MMNYNPEEVDTFEKLKTKFKNFGGLSLETNDEERFFVAYKLQGKRCQDEESLFNELCSEALNGDRIVNMALLEKVEIEMKPADVVAATPPVSNLKKPQIVNTGKRATLQNLSNFSPKTPRTQQSKPLRKPDSPVSLEATQFCGAFFEEPNVSSEYDSTKLLIRKLPDELFFYGKRFDVDDLNVVSIEDQIAGQLTTDEDPEKKITISGYLLIKKSESGDDLIMLKSGVSSIRLDIDALENFSYFHGMHAEFVCEAVTSNLLKAVKYVKPKLIPMSALSGGHDSLRVIVAHGPFVESAKFNPLDLLVEKALMLNAHALILSGPFYDPANKSTFTAECKQNFINMCSKLENSRLRVVIVPNAAHDLLCLQVFPTPALKNLDFGISEELSENIQFTTDPGIFDVNGVRFAVTNSQALFYLSRSEKYRGSSQGDRMARLCEHILEQQSLCPVQRDQSSPTLHEQFQTHFSERPHFVIAPNVLVPMIKNVENVVFINSKYSSKSVLRYATIDVNLRAARENYGKTALNLADYSNIVVHSENAPIN